jgi:hypothetical protein
VKDQREWIDFIDPPMICGVLSVLPWAYFLGCGLAHELFGYWCKGSTIAALMGIFLSVLMSAIAGTYGSRYWWSVTAIELGMLLFFFLRLH